MCGICGIISFEQARRYKDDVRAMNSSMSHRGPDAEGIWENEHIILGHRRLSIIDLSTAGNQPIISKDERYVLVYNGEIYNFREIKQELTDYPFQTRTDSEVILAAYSKWGKNCLHRFNGMFAFAIWDNLENELFLVRDRLGIKPLYYFIDDGKLIFSSELRAILASGLVPRRIDQDSLADYIRYQTVHAPKTIINGIKMLMPGQYMVVKSALQKNQNAGNPNVQTIHTSSHHTIQSGYYWQLGTDDPLALSPLGKTRKKVQEDILELLTRSVERRLIADVPFGAFLSGGIDSSIVVGLMASVLTQPVNTFSVTFEEKKYSESSYSQLIANRFNTRHTEVRLTPGDFLGMLPDALNAMDHPSGDGPNTWVVSKVTKEAGIAMALSGLGGDELFAGYDNFKRLKHLHQLRCLAKLPAQFRSLLSCLFDLGKPSASAFKIKELLNLTSWELTDTYQISRQTLPDCQIEKLLAQADLPYNTVDKIVREMPYARKKSHFLSTISCAEISTYMQNVLLRDTDQMSMAHALEVRVPFLDHLLVEYVLEVPDREKYPNTPKQLLVESMQNLLPENFAHRPKMGFTLPWDYWMHNQLRSFCESQVQSLARQELFNSFGLMQFWNRFQGYDPLITWSRIWALVALGNWLKNNNIN